MGAKMFIRTICGLPNRLYNRALLKYRKVKVGSNLQINGRLHLVSNTAGGIQIGDRVRINSRRSSNPIGGDIKTILFAKGNGRISIGNDCGISNATLFACDSITVGSNVLIGGSVKIYDTDFHWLDYERRISEQGGENRPVVIKDGAFVGAHTIILKGVTVGAKSIIGAGSVVTKSIPDGEIWAGNPAHFIRKIDDLEISYAYKNQSDDSSVSSER